MLLAVALLAVSTATLTVTEEAGDFHRRALLKTMKSNPYPGALDDSRAVSW